MTSSTSSSKRKNRKPFRLYSAGFLGFLVLFAALEVSVFRDIYFYGIEYRSMAGQFAELDYSFRQADPARIETIILGDSQSKDALRPDLLAAASGRDPAAIFNFSLSGGKAFEIYHTYKKYAGSMPHVKQAIVVVNEHQINDHNIENDPKFRLYAGLSDRLKVMDKDNYGELLIGWVSKAFDMRSVWSKMLQSYWNDTLPKRPLPEVWKPGGLRAETQLEQGGLTPEYAEKRADGWFEQYDIEGLQAESLDNLLRELKERGIRTVVVQIPRSEMFEETVRRKYGALQQAYFDKVRSLASQYGAEFVIMSNEGLALEEHFRDTNHVNPKGAEIVSRRVAERWLQED